MRHKTKTVLPASLNGLRGRNPVQTNKNKNHTDPLRLTDALLPSNRSAGDRRHL
jgi:hypothetical protein